MKLCEILRVILGPLLMSSALFADEKIYSWDVLNSEKSYRALVEEEFPELKLGFYHWDGNYLIGVLEDFDRGRVLLLLPGGQEGVGKISRNGKELVLPPGKPCKVKVAGGLVTHEGTVDHPESASDQGIGYWIDLEATDSLLILIKRNWPYEMEFRAAYDPDGRWKTSFQWKKEKKAPERRADAYEISRKSLVKQVKDVLAKQEKCLVRFEDGLEIIAINSPENKRDDIKFRLTVSDRVVLKNESGVREVLSAREVPERLALQRSAANVAGIRARLEIEISPETDDRVFRKTLKAAVEELYPYVEIRSGKVVE